MKAKNPEATGSKRCRLPDPEKPLVFHLFG